jgi:hypothetical protein
MELSIWMAIMLCMIFLGVIARQLDEIKDILKDKKD